MKSGALHSGPYSSPNIGSMSFGFTRHTVDDIILHDPVYIHKCVCI